VTRLIYWIVVGTIGAGAVHLAMIFLLPGAASHDLTSRLLRAGPVNSVTILAPAEAEALISFADTRVLHAVCPYDLDQGPLALVADVDETPISVVLLGPGGTVFSAITDRAATNGMLQLRLMTAEQKRDLEDTEDPQGQASDMRLVAPAARGAVLIKALVSKPRPCSNASAAARSPRNSFASGFGNCAGRAVAAQDLLRQRGALARGAGTGLRHQVRRRAAPAQMLQAGRRIAQGRADGLGLDQADDHKGGSDSKQGHG
jgi:uncharacterized membrane protein